MSICSRAASRADSRIWRARISNSSSPRFAGGDGDLQGGAAPLADALGRVAGGEELVDRLGDGLVDHVPDQAGQVAAFEDLLALAVEDPPLVVHDLVVFEEVLAGGEVSLLDLLLGPLDALGDAAGLDRHALLEAQRVEHLERPLAHEELEQFVLQRQEEAAGAGIALAAGPAAQLVVDAAGLVALGADDVQAARDDQRADLAAHRREARVELGLPAVGAVGLGVVVRAVDAALGAGDAGLLPAAAILLLGRARARGPGRRCTWDRPRRGRA